MSKRTRSTIGVILGICCIICCMGISVYAATIDPIVPMWDNVDRVSCSISFNGTAGKVICDITAVPDTDSIEGTLTLYENDVEIDEWNIDVNRSYVTILEEFTGVRGCTYRLVLDVDVYADGLSEPIEVTSTKVCR